jgi:hypothetical protein
LADKFEPADKSKLETAVNEAIKWLNASQEGSKEEYEEKQKELKGIAKYALPFSSGPYFYLPPSPPLFFLALLCKKSLVAHLVASLVQARRVLPSTKNFVLHFAFAHASSFFLILTSSDKLFILKYALQLKYTLHT